MEKFNHREHREDEKKSAVPLHVKLEGHKEHKNSSVTLCVLCG